MFAPLEDGDISLKRILLIYEMLDPQDFQGEWVPGYFNGKSDHVSEEELRDLGQKHILGLKQLMDDHAEMEEAVEASAYLGTVSEVVIVPGGEFEKFRQEYDPAVHESLFELVSEHTNVQEPVQMLSEAYYSVPVITGVRTTSNGTATGLKETCLHRILSCTSSDIRQFLRTVSCISVNRRC